MNDSCESSGTVVADLIRRSTDIIEEFRDRCRRSGYAEATRKPLVARHDPSVRFTNSTISVLKPMLDASIGQGAFLIQPALRLRNLAHWTRNGSMSGVGCSFMAMGALSSPDRVLEMHEEVTAFLVEQLAVDAGRLLVRISSQDRDLVRASGALGLAVELDGYEAKRFQHIFGMPDIAGRNSNFAIRSSAGYLDVANVIIIERLGVPIAVEMALGVNMILALADDAAHPVCASTGALAAAWGIRNLMTMDAMGSAVTMATEHMRPAARGRAGNYRSFLRVLADDPDTGPATSSRMLAAILAVAEGESSLRSHASASAADAVRDAAPAEVAGAVSAAIESLRPA